MTYRKITLEVTVKEEDAEILTQAMGCAMDKVEEQITVFSSEIHVSEAAEPENAEEIAAFAV